MAAMLVMLCALAVFIGAYQIAERVVPDSAWDKLLHAFRMD